jgi:hypothetical protein
MYDEAQEKFKSVKEEERFFFKIVKSKKRKPKQEPANPFGKLFEVKKYVVPKGSSSSKDLPSSGSSSDQGSHEDPNEEVNSNESMKSVEKEIE